MNKRNTKKRVKKNSKKIYNFTKKLKSYKSLKSKTRQKTKKYKNKYYFGGFSMDEATNIESRDNFRAGFIPNIIKLKQAVDSNKPDEIQEILNTLTTEFTNQKMGINNRILATISTFEPIDKSTYSSQTTGRIALYPCLVIVYENISDTEIRKILTESFINNGGNINLISNKGDVTALSTAIKLKDKSLIQLLIKNGASIETLNEEQQIQMNNILTAPVANELQPDITQVKEEPDISTTKLVIPSELPPQSGYPIDVEPEFWVPLFGVNNMFILRDKLRSMMENDMRIPMDETDRSKISDTWSVCKIIQGLIPTYFVPTKNKGKQPRGPLGPTVYDSPTDFYQYNIFLCATLLLFGIISQKMKFQDYQLIFKGGKAIQLVLSKIPNFDMYESEDIDILLMPNKDIQYNEINVKNLSGHIAYLIQWFLATTTPNISVLVPNPEDKRSNPFIFKVSYIKQDKRFNPISDIDFRDIPDNIRSYFERAVDFPFPIAELGERVSFKCPDIGSLLDEKLYYYAKYTTFKDLLTKRQPITEPGYENLTVEQCNYLLDKFKRAITSLNKGLERIRLTKKGLTDLPPDKLLEKEKSSIINRLNKNDIKENNLVSNIISTLYS